MGRMAESLPQIRRLYDLRLFKDNAAAAAGDLAYYKDFSAK